VRNERPSNSAGDRRFEILCQLATATKPCESTFEDPSAWQNFEALRRVGTFDNFYFPFADRYLRGLFVAGALAVIRYAKIHGTKHRPWLTALLARRPTKVAAIALANKIARMVWAMMARGERYKEPVALAR
jgi:hypothetical protein